MVTQDTERVGSAAYRVLFEHNCEGVLFSEPDGRITAANPAACALLDMSGEEICLLGCDGLVDRDDPRWTLAVAERDRTGSSVGVARLRRGDGRFIDVETTSRLFEDESGSVRILSILRDITGRIAIEREMEELSARLFLLSQGDELTGCQNRRGLIGAGTRLLQQADRQGADVRVLFVDVGNVQELNERLGHRAGDAALQAVARALSVTFRKHDVVARIGGTAFLVLALGFAETECTGATGRIRRLLSAPRPSSSSARRSTCPSAGRPGRREIARRSRSSWPGPTGPCSRPGTPGGQAGGGPPPQAALWDARPNRHR